LRRFALRASRDWRRRTRSDIFALLFRRFLFDFCCCCYVITLDVLLIRRGRRDDLFSLLLLFLRFCHVYEYQQRSARVPRCEESAKILLLLQKLSSFEFKNFTQTLNYTEDKKKLQICATKIQNKKQRTVCSCNKYHRPRALLLLRAERERESDDGD